MGFVLQKLCGHQFMEEMMQGRTFNPERTAYACRHTCAGSFLTRAVCRRRKAMAQQLCIECKWLRNIQADSNNYLTGQPGVVATRGASMPPEQQGELLSPQPKASARARCCCGSHRSRRTIA